MALKRATYTRPSGQEPGLDEYEGAAVAAKPRARTRAERPSGVRRRRWEFRKELSFLFNSLPTLETAQPEVGSSGWKSTARRVVSGAFPAALENPEDRVPLTPGRTHNRIRSPR
ncbi:hypothetical protein YC2023_002983 [Brassica napus]